MLPVNTLSLAGLQVPLTTATMTPDEAGLSTTVGPPENMGSIPWLWILGGVIVIGSIIVGAFIAWRKEQDQG
ncbi:MAG: hypothetical protein LLF84_00140 [Methanoregulaceae archaeon]|nr:hypothetical protein [Methanoregulaceae archaeon]